MVYLFEGVKCRTNFPLEEKYFSTVEKYFSTVENLFGSKAKVFSITRGTGFVQWTQSPIS